MCNYKYDISVSTEITYILVYYNTWQYIQQYT